MSDTTLEAAAMCWLRYERRCYLVCVERTPLPELCVPDVLGMGQDRKLIEVEVKRTMADFRANKEKRGIRYRVGWPKQFYFMVEPSIAERANEEIKGDSLTYQRCGLLTLGEAVDMLNGLPVVRCIIPAPVNRDAVRLSPFAVGKMIRHQSGTLARLAATNALIRKNLTAGKG